ncbi:MAG: ubiquinol-cytochrome C reductase [Legionella sp.]|nr:MAG: ubiquinol-cytochrome C reductase [Legionella sp.]
MYAVLHSIGISSFVAKTDRSMTWVTLLLRGGCLMALMVWGSFAHAGTSSVPSRTRGAVVFMNYCSGCHALRYLSWSRTSSDLQLSPSLVVRLDDRLVLPTMEVTKTWPQTSMATQDATTWFGKVPPDLSLIHRQRGSAWLMAYLQGFYSDHTRVFGVSNTMFPQVMMPNVLESMHDELSEQAFTMVVADIVEFLEYASDPSVLVRSRLGVLVAGFFALFALLFWLRMIR